MAPGSASRRDEIEERLPDLASVGPDDRMWPPVNDDADVPDQGRQPEAAVSELISVEEDPPDLATLTWDALATAATARPACSGYDHG